MDQPRRPTPQVPPASHGTQRPLSRVSTATPALRSQEARTMPPAGASGSGMGKTFRAWPLPGAVVRPVSRADRPVRVKRRKIVPLDPPSAGPLTRPPGRRRRDGPGRPGVCAGRAGTPPGIPHPGHFFGGHPLAHHWPRLPLRSLRPQEPRTATAAHPHESLAPQDSACLASLEQLQGLSLQLLQWSVRRVRWWAGGGGAGRSCPRRPAGRCRWWHWTTGWPGRRWPRPLRPR